MAGKFVSTEGHVSPQVQTLPTVCLEKKLNKNRILTNKGLAARVSVKSKLADFESVVLDNVFAPLSYTWERILGESQVFVDPTRHFMKTKKYSCAVTSSVEHMASLYKRFVHIKMWIAEKNPRPRTTSQSTPMFAILGNENLSLTPTDSKNDYSIPSTNDVPPPHTEVAKPQLEKLTEAPEIPVSLKVSEGRDHPKGRGRPKAIDKLQTSLKTKPMPTIHEKESNQIGCDRQQDVEMSKDVSYSSLGKTDVQTRPRRQSIPTVFYTSESTSSKIRKTRAYAKRVPKVSGAQPVANQSKTLQNKIQQNVKSVTVSPATESWTLMTNQPLPTCQEVRVNVQLAQVSEKLVEPLKLVREIADSKKGKMQVVKPLESSEVSALQRAAKNQIRHVNYEKENGLENAAVAPIIEKSNKTTLRSIEVASNPQVNNKPPTKVAISKTKPQKKTLQTVEEPEVLRVLIHPAARVRSRSVDPSSRHRQVDQSSQVKPSQAASSTQGSSSGPSKVQAVKSTSKVSRSQNSQEGRIANSIQQKQNSVPQLRDAQDPARIGMRTKAIIRSRSIGPDTVKSRVNTELVSNSKQFDGRGNQRKRGCEYDDRLDDEEYKKRICNYWCRLAPYEYRKMQQEIYGLKTADDEYQIVKRLPYTFTIFLTAMNVK